MSNEFIYQNIDSIHEKLQSIQELLRVSYSEELKLPRKYLYFGKKAIFNDSIPNKKEFQKMEMKRKANKIIRFISLFMRFNNYHLTHEKSYNGKFERWWTIKNSKSKKREDIRVSRTFYSIVPSPVSLSTLK